MGTVATMPLFTVQPLRGNHSATRLHISRTHNTATRSTLQEALTLPPGCTSGDAALVAPVRRRHHGERPHRGLDSEASQRLRGRHAALPAAGVNTHHPPPPPSHPTAVGFEAARPSKILDSFNGDSFTNFRFRLNLCCQKLGCPTVQCMRNKTALQVFSSFFCWLLFMTPETHAHAYLQIQSVSGVLSAIQQSTNVSAFWIEWGKISSPIFVRFFPFSFFFVAPFLFCYVFWAVYVAFVR
jgi:hypothetical protein